MKKSLFILLFMALACAVSARTLYVTYSDPENNVKNMEMTDRGGKFVFEIDNLARIRMSLSNNPDMINESFYFRVFQRHDIGCKLQPLRHLLGENMDDLFTLPYFGFYHIEIAADLSYGIFMTDVSDELVEAVPFVEEVPNNYPGKPKREFTKISDTEYELDCSGDNLIPAHFEFRIVLQNGSSGLPDTCEYGTSALTPVSGESYWETGKTTVLESDFCGKMRLTRIPDNPDVVRVVLEP